MTHHSTATELLKKGQFVMRNENDSRFEREITKKSTVFSVTVTTAFNPACRLKRTTFPPTQKPQGSKAAYTVP